MITIPKEIETFVREAVVATAMCLPKTYLEPKKLNKIQAGFRYNALTNEPLTGTGRGCWKENWYVVATNYFLDPFFVDFSEHTKGFPVYYDVSGSGWTATKVADSVQEFSSLIKQIESFERMNDSQALLLFLEENTNIKNKLWKEVYRSVKEDIKEKSAKGNKKKTSAPLLDTGNFVKEIVITDVGANRAKVAAYLKSTLKLSLSEAMTLVKKDRIVINTGRCLPKGDVDYLKSVGATLEDKTTELAEPIHLKERQAYKLSELIECVKQGDTRIENYCLYTKIDTCNEDYDENMVCYLDNYPDGDDNYPAFVEENQLDYYYMGQQFVDVVRVAIDEKQKAHHRGKCDSKEVTMGEYVESLEYYSENDAFMEF